MIYSALSEFPILAIAAIGFYISLRFLRFPDLTVDASFMFGMSIVGLTITSNASNEIPSLFIAPILGAIVGMITGFLHTSKYLGLNKFLSGMLVAFASYSICYRMCGQADLSLFEFQSRFLIFQFFKDTSLYIEPLGLSSVAILVWLTIQRLLNSPFGMAIRTAGYRPDVLKVSGYNPKTFIILGLSFSNAIIAIAGWLDASVNRNVSLKNFGMVINVLAACLIGDFLRYLILGLVGKKYAHLKNSTLVYLSSPVIGALAYSFIKSFVIKILSGQLVITITTDLQFIIALSIILAILAAKRLKTEIDIDNNGDI